MSEAIDAIAQAGLYFDDLNKIRVLEPDLAAQTNELKDECRDFINRIPIELWSNNKIVNDFKEMVDNVADVVEKEKLKAIGSRNLLKSVTKQRETEQGQLRALIVEKRMELDRLRDSSCRILTLSLLKADIQLRKHSEGDLTITESCHIASMSRIFFHNLAW